AACAGAISGESCDDYLTGNSPPVCRPAGTLPAGAACGSAGQCQSGFCYFTGTSCGTCTARAREGESCVSTACDYGLACTGSAGSQKCARFGALGAACGNTGDPFCIPTLSCQANKCATPLKLGDTCNPASPGCANLLGHYCDTATKKCVAYATARAGEACGQMGTSYTL